MLKELTLYGEVDKVLLAVRRLQLNQPPEGYYVAFSGGKDSCVILDLCKRAGVKFDAHFNVTTVDPPEVIRFVHQYHPEVIFEKPEMPMAKVIEKKKILPTQIARYCCAIFKERGGAGRFVVTGVRREESPRRAKRNLIEPCHGKAGKRFIHPIIEWTKDDVWEYIKKFHLAYCSLYDEGFHRIGCVCCPFATRRQKEVEMKRWPGIFKNQWERGAKLAWNAREQAGMKNFASPEEMLQGWINGKAKEKELPMDNLFGIMGDETMT